MAPPAVVYVVAAVVGVAAVFMFKEFVYEPHIAPTVEVWAENFLERRRAARNRRASAVPVRASRHRNSHSSSDITPHDNDLHSDRNEGEGGLGPEDGFELEVLASREVDEWRNEVLRSQGRTEDGLRERRVNRFRDNLDGFDSTSTTLDESFASLTHTPLASTHVISNVSSPITPSTVSLPQTPTRHLRCVSQPTTAQEDANTALVAPRSPPPFSVDEMTAMSANEVSPGSTAPTPRPPSAGVSYLDLTTPSPFVIHTTDHSSSVNEGMPPPLPFTPTYQVVADDSPFGPLLPDTPRSSAEMYGERPFSPITRVMGSSSGVMPSASSTQTVGSPRLVRKPSGLANELVASNSDDGSHEDDHLDATTTTFTFANLGPGTSDSILSSLSERYPVPSTPPIIVSSPASSIGIISAPSSPRSENSEVVVQRDAVDPRSHASPPLLQLPLALGPGSISRSRSTAHSATSPTLSYASFPSPVPMSRAVSESETDEFLSVASDDSDWHASPVLSSRGAGPVHDMANNPFLDFEHLTHGSRGGSDASEGSEVLVADLLHEGESEIGSEESWGSARRH